MAAEFRGTTIIGVQRDNKIVIAGDGQCTMGQACISKGNAVKVRRIYNNKVVCGFAGSVADAFTLLGRFEEMLQKFSGNLMRSAVELVQNWRRDKYLRNLAAMMIVADSEKMLMISGDGNVIEPENGICAIGSGGFYALSAGRALLENTELSAKEIASKALLIASDICVYTNTNLTIEEV